ncbi:iron ABC transporter substrate-binding protein [Hyphomicrobium sp.]|uniref:iron ABC transporter substrate-binding protein n=1 Tax=Hyphomicrobium sp. TaxID=82 RepID=UPI002FE0751F
MMRRLSAFALSLLILTASALSAPSGNRFVDDAGRTIEIPARIERVMAAGPPASVLLYVLAPDKMVGWVTAPTEAQKPFIAEPFRSLPAHGRITGRGGTANVEAVLSLKPDLIIDVGSVNATYASLADRVQTQTGIPYILIDGRFKGSAQTLRKVGDLIGDRERTEHLVRYAEDAMARLEREIAAVPREKRPRVYYGRDPNGLETGLAGSINMEVLDAVGAINVAESAGSGGLANVSLEQVLSWNPDVIITLDPTFQRSVQHDTLWASIAAVHNGRVHRAPTLPFGWFDSPPGINRLMSVFWLAAVLYPDTLHGDLRQEARAFYRLFYHVELSDADLDVLLADVQGYR